ncbi:type III-B CRISPR module RAMP protein Cmr4 [Vallitalea pronyensis]|uniref:CRISPR type III-B/RAMP module-associated protein Cmr5 n=1 Tax=Vallitalea pronyensis TaxID=1348613 RepID=A0A8J8SI14_9FIRM|nr:type III-B CRISPR module RAMP protein Cmr4 [Vallitalea pronyensis]QUI23982.1 type III-B CRISPR module RAMP protein Cmr4 [Vallitalea pronyensis]
MNSNILIITLDTPTHAGASVGDVGIDKPIQRERVTAIPKIESSTLKGSIRRKTTDSDTYFGKPDCPSSIIITDARLLFFPVRCSHGLYMYITCPYILSTFHQVVIQHSKKEILSQAFMESLDNVLSGYLYYLPRDLEEDNKLSHDSHSHTFYLGDEAYIGVPTQGMKELTHLGLKKMDYKKIALISNEDFSYMVEHYTEITMRNRIDEETGVTNKGALFSEEYLPRHTVMYAELMDTTDKKTFELHKKIQLGGNTTLGKGLMSLDKWKLSITQDVNTNQKESNVIPMISSDQNMNDNIRDRHVHESISAYESVNAYREQVYTILSETEREKALKEYKSHIRRLPSLIQKNGLLNTMLYVKANTMKKDKADEKKEHNDTAINKQAINVWKYVYEAICEGVLDNQKKTDDTADDPLITTILDAYNNHQGHIMTTKVLHYVVCLKRLVEGLIE